MSSDGLCWYCSRNPAAPGLAYERPMRRAHKVTPTEVTWEIKKIPIPRCTACRDAHRRADASIQWMYLAAVAVGGAVFGGLYLATGSGHSFWGGLVALWIFMALFVRRTTEGLATQGTRHEFEVSEHPDVAAALREGWKEGEVQ